MAERGMRYRRCLSNELKGYRCVYVAHIYFILAFIFYNLKVSSLVRAWKISRGPHKLSFLSPPSFFMLHTVVPLMRLVTDQLSAGVQHNYLSFRFFHLLQNTQTLWRWDKADSKNTLLTWANSVWGEISFKQHFALKHEFDKSMYVCAQGEWVSW